MTRDDVEKYLKVRTIEEGGCWIWQLACTGAGHPVASIGGRRALSVRRWAWEQWHGREAGDRRIVPTCRNPKCVNPQHAQAMTPGDVNRWLAANGRMSTAAVRISRARNAQKRSPLTIEDVRAIRARRAAGETLEQIRSDYPVSLDAIGRICRCRTWIDHAANPFAQLVRIAA